MTDQSPATPPAVVYVQQQQRAPGVAVASMVLGIIAIVTGIIPLFIGLIVSFVPTVLAVVLGIVGLYRTSAGPGRGMAVTGLILGGLTFLLYFVGYGTLW